jgi:transcriptional regulator with XRE-family HTH domain
MLGFMRFGELISAARTEQGLQSVQLAKEVGISRPFLWELERGTRSPSETTALALAHRLGLDPAVVLATAGLVSESAKLWLSARPDAIELVERLARSNANEVLVGKLLRKVAK